MTIEFTQENFTVEVDEQNNVVEIRYQGLNAGLLQALTTRVDVLEDEIDTVLGESNGSIGTLTTTVNGLSVQVTAVTNNLTAEIAARIAGDEANSAALIATEADLAADIAAETAARGAALIAEAAARNGAISAATAPIISAHNGLAATVAGLSGDVDAVELSQAGLVVSQAALSAEVDALDVSFTALSADFDDTNAAVLAESSARAVAEAAIIASIPTTENIQDVVGAMVVPGTNIAVTYDDGANTLTVSHTGGGSGDVSTDAIWDAAGDLVVGSGANTAAKLSVGAEGEVLTVVSGVPAWAAATVSAEVLRPYIGKNLFPVEPASPNSIDDEFLTTLDTTTKWTVQAGSAGNASIVAGGLKFVGQLLITQPISGSSWQITSRFALSDLSTDVGFILVFGNVANNAAVYFGGYHRAGSGSYPLFYSATMPLSGGWTATSAAASTENPTWLNYAKMMNHRVTLDSGTLTYTIAEDAADELYRKPYSNNTLSASVITGGIDVVGIYRTGGSEPALVEFFRRTA